MRTKLFIFLYIPLLLCGCNRPAGYMGFRNKIEFESYEQLVEDMKKEDELAKQLLNSYKYSLLERINLPIFDAGLTNSLKTQYFKYGQDVTDFVESKDREQLGSIRIMRCRFVYIANTFENYQILFAFYNNLDGLELNASSFKWSTITNSNDGIDASFGIFDYVDELIKDQSNTYTKAEAYKIEDENNNRVITMHILGSENLDSIYDFYDDYVMEKCKEMIL